MNNPLLLRSVYCIVPAIMTITCHIYHIYCMFISDTYWSYMTIRQLLDPLDGNIYSLSIFLLQLSVVATSHHWMEPFTLRVTLRSTPTFRTVCGAWESLLDTGFTSTLPSWARSPFMTTSLSGWYSFLPPVYSLKEKKKKKIIKLQSFCYCSNS